MDIIYRINGCIKNVKELHQNQFHLLISLNYFIVTVCATIAHSCLNVSTVIGKQQEAITYHL